MQAPIGAFFIPSTEAKRITVDGLKTKSRTHDLKGGFMFFNKVYFAPEGEVGGGEATTTTETTDKVVFTPEQQAKIDELISKAFAKGARSGKKDADAQAQQAQEQVKAKDDELKAARDALEQEKASIAKERSLLSASKALSKVGYVLEGDDNDLLIGMVVGDDCESKVATLKKLIDAQVASEVSRKLGESARVPGAGKTSTTNEGSKINDLFRQALKR